MGSPGEMLEMQISGFYFRPTEAETGVETLQALLVTLCWILRIISADTTLYFIFFSLNIIIFTFFISQLT